MKAVLIANPDSNIDLINGAIHKNANATMLTDLAQPGATGATGACVTTPLPPEPATARTKSPDTSNAKETNASVMITKTALVKTVNPVLTHFPS